MKKNMLIILSVTLFFGLQIKAQNIVYGTVDYSGFNSIQNGALWDKRPEARIIFQGGRPSGGVEEIKILSSKTFVKFVKGEHNNFDRNYIVFPKGEIIYKKEGRWYSARCGNEIEYWNSVDEVIIKAASEYNDNVSNNVDEVIIKAASEYNDNVSNFIFKPTDKISEDLNLNIPVGKEVLQANKKWHQTTGFKVGVVSVSIIGLVGGTWLLLKTGAGNPGGAPTNTEGGGPGGANTTP